jgi:hypothetical protein
MLFLKRLTLLVFALSPSFASSFLLPSSFIPSACPSTPPAAVHVTHFSLVLPPLPCPRPPLLPCDTAAAAALILLASRSLAHTPRCLSLSFSPLPLPSPRRALSRSRAVNATDTPRRCLSQATRAHVIRALQPPLHRQRWTLDFTYFVVTSAWPSRFVLIFTFSPSLRVSSSSLSPYHTPSVPSRSTVPAAHHSFRPLTLVFSTTYLTTAKRSCRRRSFFAFTSSRSPFFKERFSRFILVRLLALDI